ncbi:MAG: hypothetical protein EOO01_14335 [Chitinophagaceae bacterium]|nr:MAG: hypothetical protein EOO01_14335 [Chitinophagaceae bacterium]
MKRSGKRGMILIGMLIILTGAVVMLREYFRTPSGMTELKPYWMGTVAELARKFRDDEQQANSQFLGRILEVKGIVDNVSSEGDSIFNVTLGFGEAGNISCTMNPSQNSEVRKLRSGDTVSVRGECAGFLADVELNRCELIK